jgi:tight adherence protein C
VSISVALVIAPSFLIKIAVVAFGMFLAVLGPESILKFIRGRFQKALIRGTPDALDLLVVCSEAGMGLESALERVAQEMKETNGPMASILFSLLDDLRVLPGRREAFANLGVRSGVDGLRRMGTMLSQSMQHGTAVGSVLRAVAEELRRDRMNRLEEKAIKLPAKLIFPLIFFIMPSMYIVLLGPSFMGLSRTLSALTR